MKKTTTALLLVATLLAVAFVVSACGQSDATVAAHNISVKAEQFQVARRIVFINGITDKYLLEIDGYCSVETANSGLAGSIAVTCKVGDGQYKKSYLGLSDNVTYLVEQVDPVDVSTSRYKVIFKPSTIVPDINFK